MADYKSIIKGTFNALIGKVKKATENVNVRETYDRSAAKAKTYARITKLSLEINGENEALRKIYTEIGKAYYEQTNEAPESFADLFAKADDISGRIDNMKAEIAALKAEADNAYKDIDVEITELEDIVTDAEEENSSEE